MGSCGMARPPDVNATPTITSSTPKANWSAPTGSAPSVATSSTQPSTNVLAAATPPMEPRTVLKLRRAKALTPYIPEAWEQWLRACNLVNRYPSIPDGLHHGFHAGLSDIASSFTPPNNPSIELHASMFKEIVDKEFTKGRYISPFDLETITDLLGPIQTAPLSLVPKLGKPGKFRLVQNLSFPHNPAGSISSVNSRVDPNQFPTHYSTFHIMSLLICRLPPGSEAAVRDVAEAYRTVPSHPSQWPSLAVRLSNNDFAVDTSLCFGFGPSGGIYGKLGEAGADIMRHAGIGPIARWVDDHIFFRIRRENLPAYNHLRTLLAKQISGQGGYVTEGGRSWFTGGKLPNDQTEEFDEDMSCPLGDLLQSSPRSDHDQQFSYSIKDIDDISNQLGIPWELSKDVPFSSQPTFIGLIWDLAARTVTLTETKRVKYVDAITVWERKRTHTLEEVQKLHGKLLHASLVFPAGRAHLVNLEAMLGIFGNNPFMPRTPPRATPEDLSWWKRALSTLPLPSTTLPGLQQVHDFHAFSDASSSTGIGITIGERWRAWRLKPGWHDDGRDIGWAESVGFELLVCTIISACPPHLHFKVFGDNSGVVDGWANGRSRNKSVNDVFKRLHLLLQDSGCEVVARYIPSATNPADRPSQGIFASSHLLLPRIPIPPTLIPFIEDYDILGAPPPSPLVLHNDHPC